MLTDIQLGGIAVRLALEFPRWIERRVVRVSYLDRATTEWSIGVMFKWPLAEFFPEGSTPANGDRVYVPLDLLGKKPLIGLEGRSPDDRPFPILSVGRSARLAYLGIAGIAWGEAEKAGTSPLDQKTLEAIEAIVAAPSARASALKDAAFADPGSELATLFPDEDPVRGLLGELTTSVMMLAPAEYQAGEELVYRYRYCQTTENPYPLLTRARDRLRFRDVVVEHDPLSFGLSRSYHFEAQAPAEVEIPRARLAGRYTDARQPLPVAEAGASHVVDLHARRPTKEALALLPGMVPSVRPPLLPDPPSDSTVAAQLPAAQAAAPSDPDRADVGWAKIWFRLETSGTFLAVTLVSLLTSVLLVAAVLRLKELDGQTGAALLLALPVVMLGLMTKPGEHTFTTRLLVGIRFASLGVGLCSLAVAVILAGGFLHRYAGTAPGYKCEARVNDTPHRRAPHKTWRSTPDPDIPELVCHNRKGEAAKTEVREPLKSIAFALMGLAVLLTAWLTGGWLWTRLRSDGMLPLAEA